MRLSAYEQVPAGITELWERVQKKWDDLDLSICQTLIESMPSRMEKVVKAKGGYIRY